MDDELERVKKEYEERQRKKKEREDKEKSEDSDKDKDKSKDKSKQNFFALRIEKKRQIELAKRNRERIAQPNFFPSVPKGAPNGG
ncbi:hypothetical protein ACHAPS_008401 [Verticillium nonalfalfae]